MSRLADALHNDSNGYLVFQGAPKQGKQVWNSIQPPGVMPQFEEFYRRALYVSYYCAICEEHVQYDKYGYRKNRNQPVWLHTKSGQPWCAVTKQHGPKTRRALPVPGLLVIQELGVL
jgi:hypothetical protein